MAIHRNDRGLRHHPGAMGVDEAGRGPLAGPVVVAAVVLPRGFPIDGLDDSKKLEPKVRVALAERIKAKAKWVICYADVDEIDRLNILWATMAAMGRAIESLQSKYGFLLCMETTEPALELPLPPITDNRLPTADHRRPITRILVDGNRVPEGITGTAVIKGDGRYACIAAASILAKTERDRLMTELAADYPAYGFDKHFGYATPEHLAALEVHGPCPCHRRSFAPCRRDEQLCLTFAD